MVLLTFCWRGRVRRSIVVGLCGASAWVLAALSGCDAQSAASPAEQPAHPTNATTGNRFFSATVPAPTPHLPQLQQQGSTSAPSTACLGSVDPQRFSSLTCLTGVHAGQTTEGLPCRLTVDTDHQRIIFQGPTTTVALSHERLAMSAQGQTIYNLEGLHDATGADGVRLMHMQTGAADATQTVTQSITLMAAAPSALTGASTQSRTTSVPLSWIYAQDGVTPAVRVECHGGA